MPKKGSNTKDGKYQYYKGSFVIGKKDDGTPERIYIRGKTKTEFDTKMAEAKRLYARGIQLGDITVNEWSDRWLAIYKANASTTQKAHYKAKLRNDILPHIGNMHMKDVRNTHLQAILNTYTGNKKGTVEKIRIAIAQLFEYAELEGVIERNPASKLTLPELKETTRRPLTSSEREVMLKVAETHPHGLYILTLLYCGLRRGECLALLRSDIDFAKKQINISKALNFNESNTGKLSSTKAAKLRTKTVKNIAVGARTVPIPDILLPLLKSHCANKNANDMLFTKADGKQATQVAVSGWWKSIKRQCHITAGAKLYRNAIKVETSPFGDEITPHYLRHTYATDLYSAGIDEKARKLFLGHASNDVTDIYTQMSDEAFDRAAKALNHFYATQLKLRGTDVA